MTPADVATIVTLALGNDGEELADATHDALAALFVSMDARDSRVLGLEARQAFVAKLDVRNFECISNTIFYE